MAGERVGRRDPVGRPPCTIAPVGGIKADLKLRAAEAQLHRMSDRELSDLGLCRADITFAIREAAEGVTPAFEGAGERIAAANQNLRRAALARLRVSVA